jgi:hypothetical protein
LGELNVNVTDNVFLGYDKKKINGMKLFAVRLEPKLLHGNSLPIDLVP